LEFPRSRYKAPSSSPDLGSLVVTHPFHPLFGQCLPVLFTKRRGGALVVVCAGGVGGRVTVTLPLTWTDRGPMPDEPRLSVDALVALGDLLTALIDMAAQKGKDLV
jgi:hypothetical protein